MARPTSVDLLKYFLYLGSLGFGGPVALVGYMQRDLVERRQWFTREEYMKSLALSQLAPGPLAAQLAICLGYVHSRVRGATLVALAFVLPSFVMTVAIGWLYVRFGGLSWMQAAFYGVGATVIGIITIAAYKLAKLTMAKDKLQWVIFAAHGGRHGVDGIRDPLAVPAVRGGGHGRPGASGLAQASRRRVLRGGGDARASSSRSCGSLPRPARSSSAAVWRSCRSSTAGW